jgi:hypothetical protein
VRLLPIRLRKGIWHGVAISSNQKFKELAMICSATLPSPEETQPSPAALTKLTAQFNHDQDACVDLQPDEAIGEVLEWLADVIANKGPISTRALAACAYDSLGGLVAAAWPSAYVESNMRKALELAEGGVDLPAIKSVVILTNEP